MANKDVGKKSKRIRGIGRMKKKDLCPFTVKLAAMLDAGLPLVQSMEALSEQCVTPEFSEVVVYLRERIESGDSFAEALQYYKPLFGDLYISMIQAGEIGGGLAEVTTRLGVYMEASQALVRKVKSALTYPVIVLLIASVLSALMILFVVPQFASIYDGFDAKLPAPTQFLINVSDYVKSKVLMVIVVSAVWIYIMITLKKTEQGGMIWDRFILKAPVAGNLIEKIALARMARTFASMLRSGVPILRTLEVCAQAMGNKHLGLAMTHAGKGIEGGSGIAESLAKENIFPPMLLHMVRAGEKTGNVDGMLEKVASFYEDEVANLLESLASMIEPLLMAFLGIVIGGIVICMFLPIFKMGEIVNA